MNHELDPQNPDHELAHQTSEELHVGWPGDGSGMDDLADYNQNESLDYANEGYDSMDDYRDEE